MKRIILLSVLLLLVIPGCAKHVVYPEPSADKPTVFPADHFAHPDFRTEWWYYTGHLDDPRGNEYGFELVFFKRRTDNDVRYGVPIRWYGNPAYLAHFAVTEIGLKRHQYKEKYGRGKYGRAGASQDMYKIWIDDWKVQKIGDAHHLVADMDGYSVDLLLTPTKQPVVHGPDGISRKGTNSTSSYYISFTRLAVEGFLVLDGEPVKVTGDAWSDHEIFGSGMAETIRGWDWFSIQLDNDTELMLFYLNLKDGSVDVLSAGTFVFADGSYQSFLLEDFSITTTEQWTSPKTKTSYPAAWKIKIPKLDIELDVRTSLPDQEVRAKITQVTYYEGSIKAEGRVGDTPVFGRGYVEMSGYTHPISGM